VTDLSEYRSVRKPPDETAPEVEWNDFYDYVFEWPQDEHLAVIGPTGQGKSNLLHWALKKRRYVVIFGTKPKDGMYQNMLDSGDYKRIEEWPPRKRRWYGGSRLVTPDEMPRRLLWPDATSLNSEPAQKREFSKALNDIYVQGGWCAVWDDYWYITNVLDMLHDSKKMLMNARSNDIPFVVATQRPAGQRNVELFDQSTHLFFARDNDERNLKTIGGVGYLDSRLIQAHVAHLEPYQFLYVNTRNGYMYRTSAPLLKARKNGRRNR